LLILFLVFPSPSIVFLILVASFPCLTRSLTDPPQHAPPALTLETALRLLLGVRTWGWGQRSGKRKAGAMDRDGQGWGCARRGASSLVVFFLRALLTEHIRGAADVQIRHPRVRYHQQHRHLHHRRD
jgi:hypothetical protein